MNIHEYQAKALLHEFGVPISRGVPVLRASDSDVAAKTFPADLGGEEPDPCRRPGKGKFKEARRRQGRRAHRQVVAEVNEFAKQMLGATLVTIQTGAHGKQVNASTSRKGPTSTRVLSLDPGQPRTSEVSFVVSTEGASTSRRGA